MPACFVVALYPRAVPAFYVGVARGFVRVSVCCSGWAVFSRRLLAWCYVRFSCAPRFVAGRVVVGGCYDSSSCEAGWVCGQV